ncbi:MAG TPA: hypothetical protein VH396_04820 [Chitinophagaceae bacterium]|jgi:regulatory protein YycI of two-component signal transduction system YycFG
MPNNIEQRLWNYIDNVCDEEEREKIEVLLQNDDEWKKKYQELQQVNRLMHESVELEEPSMRFTKNVMEEIAQSHIAPATKTYINKRIINGIAAFFIIVISGLLIYGFAQINWSSTENNVSPFALYKLDISKYFGKQFLNIFLMLNVVLGLILFDMFFGKKKLKHRHN